MLLHCVSVGISTVAAIIPIIIAFVRGEAFDASALLFLCGKGFMDETFFFGVGLPWCVCCGGFCATSALPFECENQQFLPNLHEFVAKNLHGVLRFGDCRLLGLWFLRLGCGGGELPDELDLDGVRALERPLGGDLVRGLSFTPQTSHSGSVVCIVVSWLWGVLSSAASLPRMH